MRIITVSSDECSFAVTARQLKKWKTEGSFTVFQAGGFDLLTINHVLGLTHSRILGAMALLGINEILNEKDLIAVHEAASSSNIRLMVTMDTNMALEEGKSRKTENGGGLKPTLDWSTRAAMLAIQSMPSADYTRRVNLVDYITLHGPGCCQVCQVGHCINESNTRMAAGLNPDLLVINAKSLKTVGEIERYKDQGLLISTRVAEIHEEDQQYYDKILRGPVKTTSIVKRIRS